MSDNYIYIKNLKMVFATEILFEVALESWPEWDLNPLIYTHTHILKIKNSVCLHVVISSSSQLIEQNINKDKYGNSYNDSITRATHNFMLTFNLRNTIAVF